MAKSRTEKIASYDEQIAKLQDQRREEVQKKQLEERKAKEKRQRNRGEAIEKLLPDTITLTAEQFTTFLNKTTANDFGRSKLAEMVKGNEAKANPQPVPPQVEKITTTPTEDKN